MKIRKKPGATTGRGRATRRHEQPAAASTIDTADAQGRTIGGVSSERPRLWIGSIVIRVSDVPKQRDFWAAALDYVPRHSDGDDFTILGPRNGAGPNISLDQVRTTPTNPRRIHLDLYAEDQAAEVERLKGLGATEVHWDKQPADSDYVIMADPEGNRFCVIDIHR
jgi:predicted enzyme related to lactoylglutathione lyase